MLHYNPVHNLNFLEFIYLLFIPSFSPTEWSLVFLARVPSYPASLHPSVVQVVLPAAYRSSYTVVVCVSDSGVTATESRDADKETYNFHWWVMNVNEWKTSETDHRVSLKGSTWGGFSPAAPPPSVGAIINLQKSREERWETFVSKGARNKSQSSCVYLWKPKKCQIK